MKKIKSYSQVILTAPNGQTANLNFTTSIAKAISKVRKFAMLHEISIHDVRYPNPEFTTQRLIDIHESGDGSFRLEAGGTKIEYIPGQVIECL